MNYNRYIFAAVLLQNGKVLATGGADDNSLLNTTELYDPSKKRWMLTGNMNSKRMERTASILKNGKVLIVGGYDNTLNNLYSTELYDPITRRWDLSGSMKISRYFHTAVVLYDGNVLVTGGENNTNYPLYEAEIYNPFYRTWRYTGDMHSERAYHTGSLLQNGKVLVAGGYVFNVVTGILNSAEIFDPSTEEWTLTTNMTVRRRTHTATVLNNGKVLIAGGTSLINQQFTLAMNSVELYDSLTETWTTLDDMHNKRVEYTETLLLNGAVLVAGGYDDNFLPLNTSELSCV